ncbi:hypothetical protein [Streptomyces bauhiniae]|uniref:Uncharacterized protein n=1 Tax=Streptomyces bauhiniae TaxID=2340725 RepID=A0A4Z1CTR7_9ACTN|nr:hypothetical protein [Streptomyces bauhiniae]TGN72272.1 hypothetical protein E5083_30545 [Streptomyces bauhiniae]
MSSLVNTWVRLSSDRLIRADRIVGVDLWGPPNGEKQTEVVHDEPARIMLQIEGDDEEPWREAATVSAERGGELITHLLAVLNGPLGDAKVRYVYGLFRGEELSRWMHGPSIPAPPDGTVRPLHHVGNPHPGHGLTKGLLPARR